MPLIAIVGAGPGLGLSIARRFGREGFAVALISRTQSRLDEMAAGLAGHAGLRNYVMALNAALAGRGVYAAHVPLATFIGSGRQETYPDTIAGLYWDLHVSRDQAERLYSTL
jgi:NAD(P)-dependent dehydrogenase (short-subunit alcohol dehydrogenase family)